MSFKKNLVILAFTLSTIGAFGQTSVSPIQQSNLDDDIALLRRDVQADRMDIITADMQFTESQSRVFWPVYREYAHAAQVLGDRRVSLIKDYAAHYDTLTDAEAHGYVLRALKYEDDVNALRKAYVPKFTKAIGEKATAKFYQVDNQLTLLVNLQLTHELPLVK